MDIRGITVPFFFFNWWIHYAIRCSKELRNVSL